MKKYLFVILVLVVLLSSCSEDPFWFMEPEEPVTESPEPQPLVDYWSETEDGKSVMTPTMTYHYTSTYSNSATSPYTDYNPCRARLYATSDMTLEITVLTEGFYHDASAFVPSNEWYLLIENVDSNYEAYETKCHYKDGKLVVSVLEGSKDIINLFSLRGGEYRFTIICMIDGEWREKAKGKKKTSCKLYFNVAGLGDHIDTLTNNGAEK